MLPDDLAALIAALRRLHPLVMSEATGRGVRFTLRNVPGDGVELICHSNGYPRQVRGEEARLACTVYNQPEAVTVLVKHLDDFAAVAAGTHFIPAHAPRFSHHVIGHLVNAVEGNPMNTFLRVGDVDGDGRPDIVVSGRNGVLAWWHNPGVVTSPWAQRIIDPFVEHRSGGGTLFNLSKAPGLDVIAGSDNKANALVWCENPGTSVLDTVKPWRSRTIVETGKRDFPQVLIGDVTGFGELSLVYLNQCAHTDDGAILARIPVPRDPTEEPWPGGETIARLLRVDDVPEEGLLICDIDGDGKNEIVAGGSWFKWDGGSWQAHRYLDPRLGYITTSLAASDLNDDGKMEIVVCKGSRSFYHGPDAKGRLAWFSPDNGIERLWTEHVLADDLRDARSLQIGPICGPLFPDILVGEVGIRQRPEYKPRLMVWQNDGYGNFIPHLIQQGIGAQQAALCDLEGRGRTDIVTIPAYGEEKWLVHVWRQEGL